MDSEKIETCILVQYFYHERYENERKNHKTDNALDNEETFAFVFPERSRGAIWAISASSEPPLTAFPVTPPDEPIVTIHI